MIKKAVDNISFHIDKGEIVGYIGSNGAGKSTTIKMMTGILVPTAEDVLSMASSRTKTAWKRPTDWGGFRPTDPALVGFTLTETFTILKEIYNVSDQDFKERMAF